jgi:hypothetical protein
MDFGFVSTANAAVAAVDDRHPAGLSCACGVSTSAKQKIAGTTRR